MRANSKKRVALYIRVSTERQAEEGRSPESQREEMEKYCRRRGWEVVAVYQDDAVSGRRADRPGLQRLLFDAQQGKFNVAMVFYISRFYRKLESLLSTMKYLRDCDVAFVSVNEDIDFTNRWGKLILNILGTLAEIYVDELSETTSQGKRQRARSGFHNGSIPFGYCNGRCRKCSDLNGPGCCPSVGQPDRSDGKIPVPHPVDKHAVRLAYRWYGSGKYSMADIAYKLNHYRLELDGQLYAFRPKRPPSKKRRYTIPREFSADSVRDLLKRPFYLGLIEYRGGEGVAEERKKFKEAQAFYDGLHEAIISQFEYDLAQSVRRQRGRQIGQRRAGRSRVYPLSNILYSLPLRSKMRSALNGNGQRLYRDRANIGKSKLDQASRSPQPNVRAETLETQVREVLGSLNLPGDWQRRILAYLVAPENGLAEVERQQRHLQARLNRVKRLYRDGDYTLEQYRAEKQKLENKAEQLLRFPGNDDKQAEALLADFPALLRRAGNATLKDLFQTVFQRVYVQEDKIVRLIPHPAFAPYLSDPQNRLLSPADDQEPGFS